MSKVGLWSTAAGNNNATPPDGFPEGQAPSTLNDAAREVMAAVRTMAQDMEWFDHGFSPTYINANSFSITGDQTGRIVAGRRLKMYDGASTIYRSVGTASYTTITTISLGSGTAITTSLSSFALAIISSLNTSLPDGVTSILASATSLMTGPAFSAYQNSAQNVLNVTFTKVNLQAEEFDTATAFDSTTNFRFQPLVAGYYLITGSVLLGGTTGGNYVATIYKNGIEFKRGNHGPVNAIGSLTKAEVTALIYLNGSTDYVELFCYHNSGGTVATTTGAALTYFQGHLARLP